MNTELTNGPIAWDADINFGGKQKKVSRKDLFLRLKEGSNLVRIVTLAYPYLVHKDIKKTGELGFGRKIPCSQKNGSCPLCAKGYEASPRFYLGVINKDTGAYQVLDISWTTLQDLKAFANDKIWGPPTTYDINIVKDPHDVKKYYTIRPNPHTPLTPAEQQIRDTADLADLEYLAAPLSSEVVSKILVKFLAGAELAPPQPKEKRGEAKKDDGKTVARKAPPTVNLSSAEDNTDDIFPEYAETEEAV